MTEIKGLGQNEGEVLATFRLPVADGAETAHVVGEFNEWSTTAHPMTRQDDGFTAEIPLQPGRAYRFRYLLDGERWENDWAADAYVPNDFGGDDSVIDLTDAALPASATAAPEPAPRKRATKAPAKKAGAVPPVEAPALPGVTPLQSTEVAKAAKATKTTKKSTKSP